MSSLLPVVAEEDVFASVYSEIAGMITGLPTIGYGPDLKPSILRGCAATNCERTLIEVVKP